jgi:hypothetical protein
MTLAADITSFFSLLSNAGLPEINPLLELDETLADDYQKMLSEWENQMETLQVRTRECSVLLKRFKSNRLKLIKTFISLSY